MSSFKAPLIYRPTHAGRSVGAVSRFAGMPVGVELHSDWQVYTNHFQHFNDYDFTNDWTITETGAAGFSAIVTDTSPSYLALVCDALDNDSQEVQFTAANGAGEFIDLTTDRACYFEAMIRMVDANNDADTVQQVDWFVGLAVTDTTVIDGATDFVGFVKVDGTTSAIQLVCGDAGGAAGALVDQSATNTGWTVTSPTGTAATDRAARVMGANQWIKLAFLIEPHANGTQGDLWGWVNDEPISASPINVAGFVPDTNICMTLCVQNGEAVAKTLHIAHLIVAQNLRDDAGVLV